MYQCIVDKRNSFSRIFACLSAKYIFDLASNQYQRWQNNIINLGRVWAVPRLCELHPGLRTEENARKNLSQGSRRVPFDTMKTEDTEQNIRNTKSNKVPRLHRSAWCILRSERIEVEE